MGLCTAGLKETNWKFVTLFESELERSRDVAHFCSRFVQVERTGVYWSQVSATLMTYLFHFNDDNYNDGGAFKDVGRVRKLEASVIRVCSSLAPFSRTWQACSVWCSSYYCGAEHWCWNPDLLVNWSHTFFVYVLGRKVQCSPCSMENSE